jgi:hypothetical protein
LLLAEKQSITGVAGMTGELGINKHKDSGSQKKTALTMVRFFYS